MTPNACSPQSWIRENLWWILIGLGISAYVQSLVFIGAAAIHFNLMGMDTEQAAVMLYTWMHHSSDPGAISLLGSETIAGFWLISIIAGCLIGYFDTKIKVKS